MVSLPQSLESRLREQQRRWVVTGAAGFIGSHLVEALLRYDQHVVGFDNLSTGSEANLEEIRRSVPSDQWGRFAFLKGDIRKLDDCLVALRGAETVLHHAATVSVPLSIERPEETMEINVSGFSNVLQAIRDTGVRRCVYASSSSVYGDDSRLPKIEDSIGQPLSPYARSKRENEESAALFSRLFGIEVVGLRYFNVFGARQNPAGPYAGVIPQWILTLLRRGEIFINGDGSTTRDFCHVDNVVQANLLAALVREAEALGQVYNIALGSRISLLHLFDVIREAVGRRVPEALRTQVRHRDFRTGDIPHSHADIARAERLLGFQPKRELREGIDATVEWYQSK